MARSVQRGCTLIVMTSFWSDAILQVVEVAREGRTLNSQVGRAYRRFLELPPAVVLSVLWLAGLVLLGSCVLMFYFYVPFVVRLLVGA